MIPAHGQAVSANEVEDLFGRHRSNEQAVSLFNAIVWSVGDRRPSSVPTFTERVNVRDLGVDAEWSIDAAAGVAGAALLSAGWNVFQYKRREVSAGGGRDAVIKALEKDLKGALQAVVDAHAARPAKRKRSAKKGSTAVRRPRKSAASGGQPGADQGSPAPAVPARYVLFTNVHLSRAESGRLKTAILEGFLKPRSVTLDIVGAAELAAFLNDLPHLRAGFVHTSAFESWDAHWRLHLIEKPSGASVPLVGRDSELTVLRSAVADPAVRALVISGPPDAGKTRLALEATRPRALETVVALDPRVMRVRELLAITAPGRETIVIVEDPDAQTAEDLVRRILGTPDLKLVITLPTPDRAPSPGYGRDKRVVVVPIDPLESTPSQALTASAAPTLDHGLASWIAEKSGGIPGIILAAASVGTDLRREPDDFAQQVAAAFSSRARALLGEGALRVLGVLSLMLAVGVDGEARPELDVLLDHFGAGISLNEVLTAIPALVAARALRRRGPWVEVVPPMMARGLAEKAMAGRYAELIAVFGRLDDNARLRLLRRLRDVPSDEARAFWNALFAPSGPLGSPRSLLANASLLHEVAEGAPVQVADAIVQTIDSMSIDERRAIAPPARRHIVHVLETLLFYGATAERALRALLLLGEAETETWANNASGLFAEVFHPLHPQFPLALDARLRFLSSAAAPSRSREIRSLVIRAIGESFRRAGMVALRPSAGSVPLDGRPAMTYGEARRYLTVLADMIISLLADADAGVARAAGKVAPTTVAEVAVQVSWPDARRRLTALVEIAERDPDLVAPSAVNEALELLRRLEREPGHADESSQQVDGHSLEDPPGNGDGSADTGEMQAIVRSLQRRLVGGDFSTRLRIWAGPWQTSDDEYVVDDQGRRIYRYSTELDALAREAIADASLLTPDNVEWLYSESAQKSSGFWSTLGRHDLSHAFESILVHRAAVASGAMALAAYLAGRAQIDPSSVNDRIDALAIGSDGDRKVDPLAVLEATRLLSADSRGFERVVRLLETEALAPSTVARRLKYGTWLHQLPHDQLLELSKLIAGAELERAADAIDFLYPWFWSGNVPSHDLLEFAWRLTEDVATHRKTGSQDVDRLAARLTASNPDRAFALFENRLRHASLGADWIPLGDRDRSFWAELCNADVRRAVRAAMRVAVDVHKGRFPMLFGSRGIFDQKLLGQELVEFSREGEAETLAVANALTSARPGFWEIAMELTALYPDSTTLQRSLTAGLLIDEGITRGEASERLIEFRDEVEGRVGTPGLNDGTKRWLLGVLDRIERQLPAEIDAETAERVNDGRATSAARSSVTERVWAFRQLIKAGRLVELAKGLTLAEFEQLVPLLELTEQEAENCRRAFPPAA